VSDELYRKGVDYFNAGYFFEAHDTFEELWMDDRDASKRFYQGLVQLSTGCYHLVMKNVKGARSQLSKSVAKLRGYEPAYMNLDVSELLRQVEELLQRLPAEKIKDLSPELLAAIPKIKLNQ